MRPESSAFGFPSKVGSGDTPPPPSKKKCRYAIEPYYSEPKPTPKQRKAQRLAKAAVADFLSALNDINNEYGTNYTHENLLRES